MKKLPNWKKKKIKDDIGFITDMGKIGLLATVAIILKLIVSVIDTIIDFCELVMRTKERWKTR